MACPLCQKRKAKRDCPGTGQAICSVCCGTKRLVEINCPSDCVYLASAREHPAAMVRRQQEHDVAALMPSLTGLTERQQQLYFLFQSVVSRPRPEETLTHLTDDDVAEACAACAATMETAARGVLYEHVPQALPAQKLAADLTGLLAQVREQGATVYDREAATVLRAIEKGARSLTSQGPTAYLALMERLLQVNRAGGAASGGVGAGEGAGAGGHGGSRPGSLIIP